MGLVEVSILGAIAGFTIFLGLPVGRLRAPAPRLRVVLTSTTIGILAFLFWDVLTHAWEPIDTALTRHAFAGATGNGLVFITCFSVGLLGLVYLHRRGDPARRPAGPGAASLTEYSQIDPSASIASLSMMIAIGIGLHNFAEGLAIGSSAAAGDVQLATLLVIGFALHNATEGFGIVAPLAAADSRPSWGRLTLLGIIGGGPTLVGTIVGHQFTNNTVSIGFLTLAAGSILYVIVELLAVARRTGGKDTVAIGIILGVTLGFVTDAVVTAAGA